MILQGTRMSLPWYPEDPDIDNSTLGLPGFSALSGGQTMAGTHSDVSKCIS